MLKNILTQLTILSQNKWYWLLYISGSLTLLIIALFFQHAFDELPCVMCIQVRLLISLLIIVSCFGLFTRNRRVLNMISNISVIMVAAALSERSYMLLGTERGFVFSDCGFDLGLPAWFAVEQWLPWLYRVETSCGYTPEVIFGITMAEALMVMSATLLLLSLCVFVASFIRINHSAISERDVK